MKLIHYLSFLLGICSFGVNAQSPPSVDQNWDLIPSLSDEFTSFDFTKWLKLSGSNTYSDPNLAHYVDAAHAYVSGNELVIKTEKIDNNKLYTGLIEAPSNATSYSFGYGFYEIRAKLPGYYDSNGNPTGRGLFPQFWTWYIDIPTPGCKTIHDEIDITETSGSQYADGKTMYYGIWDELPGCNNQTKSLNGYITNPTPLFDNYHKYSLEWLPERVIIYFDDKIIAERYNDNTVPNHNMNRVTIGTGTDVNNPPNPDTPWPLYTYVDYFRYYRLDYDCGNDITISNQTAFNSFPFSVKKNINILNGVSAITLTNGDKKTLRYNEGVTFNGEFTVPAGAELTIINTPCN